MKERLQKILAHAGIASRRKAEKLIQDGHVTVNAAVVTELGTCADPVTDVIRVDGKRIRSASRYVYVLLNKPKNVVSTSSDPEDRPTVMDYVRAVKERIYPVGRLDFASEGLIILTNDGDFTKWMTRAGVIAKVYHVKLGGRPSDRDLQRLRQGLFVDNERLAPCSIEILREGPNPWYKVTLHQGRNQQIRRMFQVVGAPVEKLRRVKIGFLEDRKLASGQWRHLTSQEVSQFKRDFEQVPALKSTG
jgi:23S rRNA pseudouridine2605 synthase